MVLYHNASGQPVPVGSPCTHGAPISTLSAHIPTSLQPQRTEKQAARRPYNMADSNSLPAEPAPPPSDHTALTLILPDVEETYLPIDASLPPPPPHPREAYDVHLATSGALPSSTTREACDVEVGLSGALASGATRSSTSSTPSQGVSATTSGTPKKKKKKAKFVAVLLKTHMSSERTFFKYLWTGLNLGGLGTFIFITFSTSSGPYLTVTVLFAWAVAFALMVFGLWGYVRRRAALDKEDLAEVPPIMAYGPLIVCVAVACVVAAGFTYAIVGGGDVRSGGAGGGGFITG